MQHPDEGRIQGWLEGQLPAGEAREVASHVVGCDACGEVAAEIRGLMARTSGIVAALDGEGAVMPAVAGGGGGHPGEVAAAARGRRWRVSRRRWVPALAAAAVVLVVMRQASAPGPAPAPAPPTVAPAAPTGAMPVAAAPEESAPVGVSPQKSVPAPMPVPARPPAMSRAAAPPAVASATDVAGAPALVPAPAPAPVPMPMAEPAPASPAPPQLRLERNAAAKAQRMTADSRAEFQATIMTLTGCYRVISPIASKMILEAGGRAIVVGPADTTAGRWSPAGEEEGDSIVVRWHDSLAVFRAGVARTIGRYGVDGGEPRPLTVWRGCP